MNRAWQQETIRFNFKYENVPNLEFFKCLMMMWLKNFSQYKLFISVDIKNY